MEQKGLRGIAGGNKCRSLTEGEGMKLATRTSARRGSKGAVEFALRRGVMRGMYALD